MVRTSPIRLSAKRFILSDDLTIVAKIGARRGEDASWLPAFSPAELQKAVHDNLRNLGLDVLDVVNLRVMMGMVMAQRKDRLRPA